MGKTSAIYGAGSISAALFERLRSGKGQVVSANPSAMAAHFSNVDIYFNTDGSGCYEESALQKPGASTQALDINVAYMTQQFKGGQHAFLLALSDAEWDGM